MKNYYIYTDGSTHPNPGVGAYAYIIIDKSDNDNTFQYSDWEDDTTNNRMEVKAIIAGLNSIKEPSKIIVYSDSQYAINLIGYKTDKNKDLRLMLQRAMKKHKVTLTWIKGHSDNYYNNLVDRLAYETLHAAYQELNRTGLRELKKRK